MSTDRLEGLEQLIIIDELSEYLGVSILPLNAGGVVTGIATR